jgi:HPt (histidine-containing phosphotransfer) domain-containing protein
MNGSGNHDDQLEAPPLAVKELSARCMDNTALACLLLEKFETQARADLFEIAELAITRDLAGVAQRAHALKGAAGAVAAAGVRDAAANLEGSARANQLEVLSREVATLQAQIEKCLGFLPKARTELAATGSSEAAGGSP